MKTACENATRRTTWLGSSDLLSACSSSKTTSTVSRCGDELLDGTSTTSQKYWESPCYSVRLPCHQGRDLSADHLKQFIKTIPVVFDPLSIVFDPLSIVFDPLSI